MIGNKRGYAMVEMIVAIGLFAAIVVIAGGTFQSVIIGQRSTLAAQNIEEALRYSLEMASKEIRNAQINTSECSLVGAGNIYNTNAAKSELYLKNKDNKCVQYYLSGGQLYVSRGTDNLPITPSSMNITSLKFIVRQGAAVQPSATVLISGYVLGQNMQRQEMKMQTTISSRYYSD
ncbi:MAG: hypothetical protein WCW77_05765 [Patescibacteria group bacterium]